jgi:phosphoesterase RecJ-like protein
MGLDIPEKGAENLYRGLITDSGRFLFPRTGVDTYNAAIDLVETGINIEKIHNNLYVAPLTMKR